MLLKDIPGIKRHKEVHAFVKDHLSMQFEEVRKLVQMRGFNFACADLLCDLISGLSMTIFDPGNAKMSSTKAFKTLVESSFFPWDASDTTKDKQEKSRALYKFVRNPLAHSLGVDEKPGYEIKIGKRRKPLTRKQLTEVEKSPTRPAWIKPVLNGAGTAWVLSVEGLYHGVFRLFWNLAQDATQMEGAEKRFAARKFTWRKP